MASSIDPALVKICDEIAARGGPPRVAGVASGVLCPVAASAAAPVVRESARLRGDQPDVDGSKNPEGSGKRTAKSSDPGMIYGAGWCIPYDLFVLIGGLQWKLW